MANHDVANLDPKRLPLWLRVAIAVGRKCRELGFGDGHLCPTAIVNGFGLGLRGLSGMPGGLRTAPTVSHGI